MENMVNQSLLQRAIEFAAEKHAGQFRKGTTIPYFTHVMEAMEIVSRMTEDEEIRAAAVLHDTLEDTDTGKDELVRNFGQRVADLVAAESENKREDQPAEETWITRKMEGYGLFPGYEYSRFSAMVLLSPWNSGRTPWSIDPQHWALMVG